MAAAHEGIAEMIVEIEYSNGGVAEIALDSASVQALMKSTSASNLKDLEGVSWENVKDALVTAYNRFG